MNDQDGSGGFSLLPRWSLCTAAALAARSYNIRHTVQPEQVTSWKNSFSSTLEYMNEAIDGAYRDGWDGRVRTVGILWNAITPEWSRELWERAPRGLTFRPTEVQQVLNGPEMAVELQELRAFSQVRILKLAGVSFSTRTQLSCPYMPSYG